MKFSPLKQWLSQNKFFVKSGKPTTHLLMDGGKVYIPDTWMSTFHRMYALDVSNNEKNYIVETRSPSFRYVIDMDLFDEEKLGPEKLLEYINLVQYSVREISEELPENALKVIVCGCSPVLSESKGIQLYRHGYHILFPEILLTCDIAIDIRERILMEFTSKYGKRPIINPWADVFDLSIYRGNGVRMVGSRKMAPCSKCKRKRGNLCAECSGEGCVDVGRVYYPVLVVGKDGKEDKEELERLLNNTHSMIVETKIRSDKGTNIKVKSMPSIENGKIIPRKRKLAFQENRESKAPKIGEIVPQNDVIFKSVWKFIKRNFPEHPHVTKVTRCKKGEYYLANSSSTYCANKEGKHNSSNVYFHIDKNGIRQKCFCPCQVVRKYGVCKVFAGSPVALSAQLRRKLFPDKLEIECPKDMNLREKYREEDEKYVLSLIHSDYTIK